MSKLGHVRFGPALARVERALNVVIDDLNEVRLAKGIGYRLKPTSGGTTLDIQFPKVEAGGSASPATRMEIVTIEADYLTCRTERADGTVDNSETPIQVAKPTFLRVTGIHGITRDGWNYSVIAPGNFRTLTNVSAAGITAGLRVIEDLDPSYTVGDTIYASQPTGETAVSVAGVRLTWLDDNRDARHYRNRRIMLDACVLVGNVPTQKTIVFNAGPIP